MTGSLPTLEEIQQLVDRRAPERIVVTNPTWLANFRCQRRSTNVYRRGRVMLAGDAVHIHSPAGGQGMNTGMLDAHNLAWKLALVASGRSPDSLLDTYGEERAPIAAEVLGLMHALVQLGTMTHPVRRAHRDTIVPLASRISPLQLRAVRRMSHLYVAYRSSSLTRPERSLLGLRPGDRAPDIDVLGPAGAVRLYQVLRLTRPQRWAQRGPPSVFLIRPDGYIAARGRLDAKPAILNYLRRVFELSRRA